ncbi:hypothetical protein D3C83_179700 [compost metagenome]
MIELAVVHHARDTGRELRVILGDNLECRQPAGHLLHHRLDQGAGRTGALGEND